MSKFQIKDIEIDVRDLSSSELKKLEGGSTVALAFGANQFSIGGSAGGIQGPNGNAYDDNVQAQFNAPWLNSYFRSNN